MAPFRQFRLTKSRSNTERDQQFSSLEVCIPLYISFCQIADSSIDLAVVPVSPKFHLPSVRGWLLGRRECRHERVQFSMFVFWVPINHCASTLTARWLFSPWTRPASSPPVGPSITVARLIPVVRQRFCWFSLAKQRHSRPNAARSPSIASGISWTRGFAKVATSHD